MSMASKMFLQVARRAGLAVAAAGTAFALCTEEQKWKPRSFDKKGYGMPDYQNDICIVTGGSTGIGKATVDALAEAGAKVYSLDVVEPLEIQKNATHVSVDVSDVEALKLAINKIANDHDDRIDLLVSNAGVWTGGSIEQVTKKDFDRLVHINIRGTYFAIQSVIPYMKKRKDGAIIIIGSDQSLIGKADQTLYGMTKGAIGQLSKSCAIELAGHGIRVNCICPGTIDTPLVWGAIREFSNKKNVSQTDLFDWLQTAQPLARLGQPEEVAALIISIAKIPFCVGAMVSIDGGYTSQ